MQIRQIAAIALILAGAVACTGGGSDGTTSAPTPTLPPSSTTPTTAPPTTASTSATPPPTVATTGPNVRPGEKPPVYPTISRTNTRSGALSFANFWFAGLDWAYATMDPTVLAENSAASCSDCALLVSGFRQARAAHQHFKGGRLIFESSIFAINDKRDGAQQAVDVTFGQHAVRLLDGNGRTVRTDDTVSAITFRLWLKWTGHTWIAVQKAHVT